MKVFMPGVVEAGPGQGTALMIIYPLPICICIDREACLISQNPQL